MRRIRSLIVASLLALLAAPALADSTAQPFDGARAPGAAEWRQGHGRMTLGHRPVARPVPEFEISTQRTSVARQCRRWRALAAQLGETYAGHRLRSTVLERLCADQEDTSADVWAWPWSDLERGATLPPRFHRTFGAWDIRCDTASGRRRCALIHRAPVPPDELLVDGDPQIMVHFVIDMVAGRETVLWRMFVPTPLAPGAAATPPPVMPALLPGEPQGAGQSPTPRGEVRYRIGASDHAERFPACVAAGCFMEAHVTRSGAVVSRLWDGRPIELTVARAGGEPLMLRLPARGFRAAFSELMRLRRDEMRGSARK